MMKTSKEGEEEEKESIDGFPQELDNKDDHNRVDFLHILAAELRKNKANLSRVSTDDMER